MEVFELSDKTPSDISGKEDNWYEEVDEQYYTERELQFEFHGHSNHQSLHVAGLNCKGMLGDITREQLINIMEREEIDIMCLPETWNNSRIEELNDKCLFPFSTGVSNKYREPAIKNRGTRPGNRT